MSLTNIVIFASGSGTNAENLIKYFSDSPEIKVSKVLSNKEDAYVHQRAKNLNIPSESFSRSEFADESFLQKIEKANYLILAGFLWLIPPYLIQAFPNRIINIHPALLPKFGGKGMYGSRVHGAVIDNREEESGITIHLVNEEYDKGRVLFQAKCVVEEADTPDLLAQKIHALEYEHFPKVVEDYIRSNTGE